MDQESDENEDHLPDNEICMKAIELKKLDLTENKGKDYVDEILESEDLLKNPENYNQINDKTRKPLIIGIFKNKSQEEKFDIKRKLLENKNLVKTSAGNLISLSVPQIDNEEWNPIRCQILIGFECPYSGCDYRGLGKNTVNEHINEKHLKSNPNPFKCENCDKRFPLKNGLISHKHSVHSNKQIKCDFKGCKFVAKHKKYLSSHINSVHLNIVRQKSHVCVWTDCKARFDSPYKLRKHMNAVHKNSYQYDCYSPESEDFEPKSIETMIKDKKSDVIQRIDGNVYEISNNTSLINSNEFNENTINSVNTNNNNEFNESVELLDELPDNEICMKAIELKKLDLTENKGKDYVDEILLSEDLMKCHQKYSQINDKSEKPLIIGNFKSKIVEEKLKTRRKLLKNKYLVKKSSGNVISVSVPQIDIHEKNPIRSLVLIGYECPYSGCDYRYLKKNRIVEHINVKHLSVNAFKCEFCDKRFSLKSRLTTHENQVHSNQQLKCDFNGCEFVAKHKRSLTQHQKCVHLNIKRSRVLACDWPECELKFRYISDLKRHRDSVHKDIKKYNCLWPGCDAKFPSNYELKKHNWKHTGEKPYSCDWPECGEKFRCGSQLNSHKHSHEGVKPYSCPWNGCKNNFLSSSHLKRHVKCHEKGGNVKCLCCKKTKV